MGKSGKGGYYAVRRGRSVGVFRTWDECKANVDRYGGARYKKFGSEEEAWGFVNDKGSSPPPQQYAPSTTARYQPYKQQYYRPSSRGQHQVVSHDESDGPTQTSNRSYCTSTSQSYSNTATTSRTTRRQSADRVTVYTDGACSYNGQKGARAGYGVYWGDQHPDNVSQRLQGRQTNQRAEIMAATTAVEQAKSKGISKIKLHTDSKYTMNCVNSWMNNWKRNGWKTSKNQDVLNKEEIVRLDNACKHVDVQWEYVPGHSNIAGNEAADRLATRGAQK